VRALRFKYVVDFYDGPTEGLVTLDGDEQTYYACTVSFEPDRLLRVLALIPLVKPAEFQALLESISWSEQRPLVKGLLLQHQGQAQLVVLEGGNPFVRAIAAVEPGAIDGHWALDIADVTDEARVCIVRSLISGYPEY
jgi:hypothetical protein